MAIDRAARQSRAKRLSERSARVLISLGLFAAALLPRAAGLGVFVTADEAKWVYRSAQFLGALLRGDPAGTVVNLTPAVTTTWLGSLGLAAYYAWHRVRLGMPLADWLASLPEYRAELDVLVAVRWPMVLLTSLSVVAFYHLGRRLAGERAALLFALLLAFDPQFLSLSRILGHDAPAGVFAGLAMLLLLAALPRDLDRGETALAPSWRPLVASGAVAGLAFLSKSPAFFLAPFAGLVALVHSWRHGTSVRAWLPRLAAWGLAAWLVFAAVWPAGWQDPIGAPYSVVHNAFRSATDTVEAEAEGYWQVPDLGPLYYVVNGAFKLSPLAALGLLAWAVPVLARRRAPSRPECWSLVFSVLFTLFMTLGGKRSNRYLLPAWPAVYFLAAIGLSQVSLLLDKLVAIIPSRYSSRITHHVLRITHHASGAGILALLLALPALATYPYYLSYFNPLLGGSWSAPHLVKIGWGEGLDQAGGWLEEQPDAPALRVGAHYASALAPFFSGGISGVTAGGLDYVVLYVKHVQEGYPSPTILRYWQAMDPLKTVTLNGIEYARIYPGPAPQPAMANQAAFDIGILPKPLAFQLSRPYLPIGEEAWVEILWLAGDELPNESSHLTLQPAEDATRRPEERANEVFVSGAARLERRADGLIVSRHTLLVPDSLPRGAYGLLVDGRPLGVAEARRFTAPLLEERLDADFGGEVRLLGYAFDASQNTLRLAWQANPRAWADYTVFVHLVDADGGRLAGVDAQPPVPTSQWVRGEVVVEERTIPAPNDLPPGDYRLAVGLYRSDTQERLPLLDKAGAPSAESLVLPRTVRVGD
jgi:hypothetical protein